MAMDKSKEEALVRCIRSAAPEVVAIYAYGSQVSKETHPESDLDLALLLPYGRHISDWQQLELAADLETIAKIPVDLSVLDPGISLIHCKEVITSGNALYSRDERFRAEFEMQTLSAYARFCEDRRPVVEAYTIHE